LTVHWPSGSPLVVVVEALVRACSRLGRTAVLERLERLGQVATVQELFLLALDDAALLGEDLAFLPGSRNGRKK